MVVVILAHEAGIWVLESVSPRPVIAFFLHLPSSGVTDLTCPIVVF